MRRAAAVGAAALGAALVAACGLGPGDPQRGSAGAELRVTRDFGGERLATERLDQVPKGQTVMRFLQSRRKVGTRYGGGFVQSIDGVAGEGPSGRRDWFYFVNGIEADVGAAERTLVPGDVVQWDFRRWDAAMSVPAIVGAFPEPFRSGSEGKRFPVRLECERDDARACGEARRRLTAAGAPVSSGVLGDEASAKTLRVVVARWATARRVEAVQAIERGPKESGVFARIEGNRALELLDAAGRPARTAAPGTGLVAALRVGERQLVWLVTGLDDAGVERAAAALDERVLRDRFAVAATPEGPVALPAEGS